jgi:hypothetical protein
MPTFGIVALVVSVVGGAVFASYNGYVSHRLKRSSLQRSGGRSEAIIVVSGDWLFIALFAVCISVSALGLHTVYLTGREGPLLAMQWVCVACAVGVLGSSAYELWEIRT